MCEVSVESTVVMFCWQASFVRVDTVAEYKPVGQDVDRTRGDKCDERHCVAAFRIFHTMLNFCEARFQSGCLKTGSWLLAERHIVQSQTVASNNALGGLQQQ
jgi:hypothetical protein